VEKGETVFSISRRYGMTVAELRTLNGIGENNVIHVGQKLKVK
jgi:LysM repeat protein